MARALNVRTIDAIQPNKTKRQELPDNIVRGLYLVLQPSGAKSWAVRYRHEGTPAKLTLGQWPRLGLADAGDRKAQHKGQDGYSKSIAGRHRQAGRSVRRARTPNEVRRRLGLPTRGRRSCSRPTMLSQAHSARH